jgi:hypothetical protein
MPKVTRPTADPKNPHVKDIPAEKLEKFLAGGWTEVKPKKAAAKKAAPAPESDES